jgi:hypothetical protein
VGEAGRYEPLAGAKQGGRRVGGNSGLQVFRGLGGGINAAGDCEAAARVMLSQVVCGRILNIIDASKEVAELTDRT